MEFNQCSDSILKLKHESNKKNKNKKIGFFSAILLVIGSCIGAGIFFKSGTILNNVHQSLALAISAWVIAAIAVIAMALSLIEICSSSVNTDKGLMQWNKNFNNKVIYFASKNFMTFLYMPITYFFMPVFAMQSILDAFTSFGLNISNVPWWFIFIFAIIIDCWFIIFSGINSRLGNIQNWLISAFKFVPLVVAAIVGFIIFGLNNNVTPPIVDSGITTHDPWMLIGISPAFGLFTSLSAVFFAYDGFYVACGVQSQMKEPKKTSLALVFGLVFVTLIYLLIAISCMLGSTDGNWSGFRQFFASKGLSWLYGTFSLLITFGTFGILNSYAMWTPRFIENLIKDNELFKFSNKYINKLNSNKPKVGICISLITTLPIILLFFLIGSLGYIDTGNYATTVSIEVARLYSFANLTSSWTAIIAFAFIALAIIGGLINRKTKRTKVQKSKFFIPSSIIVLSIIGLSLFFEFLIPFFNFFSMINQIVIGNKITTDKIIGSSLLIMVLFLNLFFIFIPVIFDISLQNKNKKINFNI